MQDRKRILVVDDDENVRFVLARALARLGSEYDIVLAGDGGDALRLIDELAVDLLISDIRLPGLDGIALTRALRQRGQRLPVIWITAYGGPAIADKMAELDVCRCIDKPVEVAEIRRAALQALRVEPA
ncbi:MAG TPA: response regulator [Anaerolineae bacterium]|nr:response regulator [Anaerolineae bacterium]HOQ99216.1 response regulator [Anaerolineae bacterium]HPL28822.1 response regulator [Anaerolineae bacterium]